MSTAAPSPAERPESEPAAASPVPVQPLQPATPVVPPAPPLRRQAPDEAFFDPAVSHLPELRHSDLALPPQRRVMLPLMLFLATCASTFWVGVTHWDPLRVEYSASWELVGRVDRSRTGRSGLEYMAAVLAILLTHEMGHFLQTVRYGIPASYPLCIPVPFNPIGTMGAVIGMDGMRADRRQIFDIGIAGPLAGLVVAFPVLWHRHQAARPVGGGRAGRDRVLSAAGRPVDAAVGASRRRVGRGAVGRPVGAQSVLHGRLGRHADHGPEHAADQPARRRAHDLRAVPRPGPLVRPAASSRSPFCTS